MLGFTGTANSLFTLNTLQFAFGNEPALATYIR